MVPSLPPTLTRTTATGQSPYKLRKASGMETEREEKWEEDRARFRVTLYLYIKTLLARPLESPFSAPAFTTGLPMTAGLRIWRTVCG